MKQEHKTQNTNSNLKQEHSTKTTILTQITKQNHKIQNINKKTQHTYQKRKQEHSIKPTTLTQLNPENRIIKPRKWTKNLKRNHKT